MSRHRKILLRSFAGGEMSPEMFSRIDDALFQAGAETLLNCVPRPTGAAARRSGTRLVREVRDSTNTARLLSFVFNQSQSVVVEASRAEIGGLESGYFRFHANGGTLIYPHPKRYVPAISLDDANDSFSPALTVSCSIGNPMVVTYVGHALFDNDEVLFISADRTLPDAGVTANANRPVTGTVYYVRRLDADTFELSNAPTPSAHRVVTTSHIGYGPVLYNFAKWKAFDLPLQTIVASEHRLQNKDPVVLTMWPDANNPEVTWASATHFTLTIVGHASGLAQTAVVAQQVMFVTTGFGGTLPSGIQEGRLYWATTWTGGLGWTISESFGGPPHDLGTGGSGTCKICVMPEIKSGSVGFQGEFGAMRRYYAIVNANEPNIIKLETSIAAGQVVNGGLVFSDVANGCGPFKVHHAYEVGDTVSYADGAGGIRGFYSQKSWWNPEIPRLRDVLTEEAHTAAGPRTPGSAQRTSLLQGAHWREMPGRATGGIIPVTANEFTTGTTDLTLTTIGGGHGLTTGMAVAIVEGTTPAGSSLDTEYFAIVDSASALRLATSYALAVAGTPITGPTAVSPRWGGLLAQGFVSFQDSGGFTNKVIWPGHGLANGDTVVFGESDFASAVAQGGITLGTVYYVREAETDAFRISATAAGPLIEFSDHSGKFLTAIGNSIYEVPHDYTADEIAKLSTTQSGDVMTLVSQGHPVAELRRVTQSKWVIGDAALVAGVDAPAFAYESERVRGGGIRIIGAGTVSLTGHGPVGYLITITAHGFTEGTPVYIDGLPTSGAGSVPTGYYLAGETSGVGSQVRNLYLTDVESGEWIAHGGNIASGLTGRVRSGTQGEEQSQSYVVTAINQNNEESVASPAITIENNLFVPGSYNVVGWAASAGAVRYRVYKQISGLYGMIGETDDLTLKDDNIGPDLGVAPPIRDESLRRFRRVSFNDVPDAVGWVNHGLEAGRPIVFRTTDRMPGIEDGRTYYVLNPADDEFQLADDPDSEVAVSITGTDTGIHVAVSGHFPATATYFEGRRVFGGSRTRPQDIWMTASGTEGDMTYSIPTVDSDRIYFRVAARDISMIRHLIPLSQLMMLSDSTEYRLTPVNDDVLTPSSVSVRPQSFVGAGFSIPSLVNNTVVFAAARGGHMREMGYSSDVHGYLTGDLSIRAAHLFDGFTIVGQSYSKSPLPVVWCVSTSGKLLGITYIPEEKIGAWHQHTTPNGSDIGGDAVFESVTVVPEGDEDAIYVVVKRALSNGTKRFVERFANEFRGETAALPDAFFVDCGLTYDGAATTTISGLDHLDDEAVSYLADGVAGTGSISNGTLTLATAASKVHIGLPFTTRLKTLPLSMMRVEKNINQLWLRTFQSGAFEAGPTGEALRPSRSPAAGVLSSELVQVTISGQWNDDGQVVVQQTAPIPLTISGLTIEVAQGG